MCWSLESRSTQQLGNSQRILIIRDYKQCSRIEVFQNAGTYEELKTTHNNLFLQRLTIKIMIIRQSNFKRRHKAYGFLETIKNCEFGSMPCHHTSRNGKEVLWIRGFTAVETWLRGKHFSARSRKHARKTTGICHTQVFSLEVDLSTVVTEQFLYITRAVSLTFLGKVLSAGQW